MPGVTTTPLPGEWLAFRRRLLSHLRRHVNEPADAEDLVQEILGRASERLGQLKAGDRLLPWLLTMTRRALVDYYRRRGRAPTHVELPAEADHAADHAVEGDPVDGEVNRAALAACLRPMLQRIPVIYRDALVRVELNGERQVDVAGDLGLGVSALKSRVQRGRALLRDAFTDCCALARDAAGRVVDFTPKGASCPASRYRDGLTT